MEPIVIPARDAYVEKVTTKVLSLDGNSADNKNPEPMGAKPASEAGTRKVSDSAIDNYPYTLFPNDLNCYQSVFGGRLLEIADRLAGTVANMHCGRTCVTLGLDNVRFKNPAREGEILIFKAAVNRAWRTSMEVGVRVVARNTSDGAEIHIISMYFTFVGVDANGRPAAVPGVMPITVHENRRYDEAGRRRELRLAEEGRKK